MRSLFGNSIVVIIALFGFLWQGCKQEHPSSPFPDKLPELVVAFELVNGSQVRDLNEKFWDDHGNRCSFSTMKYYISNIRVEDANGTSHFLSEIELFDHAPIETDVSRPQWPDAYNYELPEGEYVKLSFDLGVPPELNEEDPTTFGNEEPLSTYSNMYWNWATMFRFIVFEASIDTFGQDTLNHSLIFHTGLDQLYRPDLSFDIDVTLGKYERDTLFLEIDWNALFHSAGQSIEIEKEHVTHCADSIEIDLARRFTENMVNAIRVR